MHSFGKFLASCVISKGKSVLHDQPTHVGRESVDCRPLVDRSSADCWPLVVRLLVVSRPSVGR